MGVNQNFGGGIEDDPELQAAMAASLAEQAQQRDIIAQNIEQTESCNRINQNPRDTNVQSAEDEAFARALAESMQVDQQNILPQPQVMGGV